MTRITELAPHFTAPSKNSREYATSVFATMITTTGPPVDVDAAKNCRIPSFPSGQLDSAVREHQPVQRSPIFAFDRRDGSFGVATTSPV